ncbi:replicative DNA helicase [Olivibacter sp. 47]|uniref:replicative DNA helicase n=1 Tax=Olivibacter sp. 47 TaxID=3056486 RepID=UPI0025A419D2|nr:replicative DNA helicase [Olivibacter sp. 47]MDM8174773.1 replicative DNA helicase [Olivibacter sp. 47]
MGGKKNQLDTLGKVPPQALDLEEVVLGALMIERNAFDVVAEILRPETFYKEAHVKIYSAIQALMINSEPIDIITVTAELRARGDLESVGGAYYITHLTDRVVSASNIEFHARILQEQYIKRELIRTSQELISQCYSPESDVFEMLSKTEYEKDEMLNTITVRKEISSADLFMKNVERLKKIGEAKNGITGITTGFVDVDRITGGWQPSDLIIVAGRPGMGKTSFVLSSAINAGLRNKIPGAIFSLEMADIQLMDKVTSIVSEVPLEKFKKGNLGDVEWMQIHRAAISIQEAPIVFDDTPAISLIEFAAKARRLKRKNNIQWIVIDYLQLMIGKTNKGGNREQEIGSLSRGLKAIAKELNIPIIALSQLSRAVESRAGHNKRPMLSDLRESGSIEQDADVVCFLYRPEYYGITEDEEGRPTAGMAELIIAKHRNGATDDVALRFVGKTTGFYDLDSGFSDNVQASFEDNPFDSPFNGIMPNGRFVDMTDDSEPF